MVEANKRGFLKMFPAKEKLLLAFMKTEKISFMKEVDVRKVFEYATK